MPHDYTVRAGDALIAVIARLCDLSQEEVQSRNLHPLNARANGLSDPDRIQPGTRLRIYCAASEIPPSESAPSTPGSASPGEGTEPDPSQPTNGETASGKAEACLESCFERYMRRIRACQQEDDAEVRAACREGAKEVLKACLDVCRARHARPVSAQPQPVESGTSPEHGSLITPQDKGRWNTEENVADLARIVMSEASIGNEAERTAVAYTVLNRMKRNGHDRVRDEFRAYATNQDATETILAFVRRLLRCEFADNTAGATHFYSPRSMPKEGEERRGDTSGGLEQVPGLSKRNYRPGWARTFEPIDVPGTKPAKYKFFRAPGTGPVR